MGNVTKMGATKFRIDLRNVINRVQAGRGPVIVTIYGEEAAVLLDIREWQRLQKDKEGVNAKDQP